MHHIQRNYLLAEQMFKTVKNKQKTNSFVIYSPCCFFLGKMALLMFLYPNQWPTVLSPCSVVAWQPGCDDKSFTLWFYGRLQKSVSIWPRVHHASHLFFKSQQNLFSTKQQVLPDLFAEWAVIRYNLLAVISNHEDNKLVILLPRPGCFFFSHQLPLTTVLSSRLTLLYFFTLFCCWLAPFVLVQTLIWSLLFSLSVVIISQVLR